MSAITNQFPAVGQATRSWVSRISFPSRKWFLISLAAAGAIASVWAISSLQSGQSVSNKSLVMYTVQSRDLPITVIERGNLESQSNVRILCEVDDVRNDGVYGTPLVWIIPNGSSVKQGDLLAEFDSTAILTELDQQVLDTERSKAEFMQADANLKNQEIENQTAKDKADLDVKLAKLDLDMYQDKDKGTHRLAVEAINRLIDDVNNEILTAEMNLTLRRNEKVGIESLFKLGYAGKSEKDRSVLSYLQAEGDYAAKLNKMKTQLASLEKIERYEYQMQMLTLEGKLKTSEQNLKQVLLTNSAKLEQAKGILAARHESLKKEEELLARFKNQLAKCKVLAPADGMVTYASDRDMEIREGAAIRKSQHFMSLPNLTQMQVQVSVHESVLDRVRVGQEATISIDAFADRRYKGKVKSVAVLPEQNYYYGSDTKVYRALVTIEEDVAQLKPGMTAVAEIHVDLLENVNAVPVQAIVQRDGKNWLYVEDGQSVLHRDITLGPSNDLYVSVSAGIQPGERVVLNPTELIETSDNADAPAEPDRPKSISETPKGTLTAALVSGPAKK